MTQRKNERSQKFICQFYFYRFTNSFEKVTTQKTFNSVKIIVYTKNVSYIYRVSHNDASVL